MTKPDKFRVYGISLGSLLKTLAEYPGASSCFWHVTRSSELVEENATHRVERVYRRLTVSIDLPEILVRLAIGGAKR